MKKTAYKILPEFNLIIECYKGKITPDDIIELKKRETQDKLYNPHSNILIDFRNLEVRDRSAIVSAIMRLNDFFQKLELKGKAAVLTTSPDHVVLSLAMKELTKNSLKINTEPFSTLDAALRFVECPFEIVNTIKNILDDFNKITA